MSVADRLTRKVGPLPVWGWAFLIVGGYLAYRKLAGGQADAGGASMGPQGYSGTPSEDTGAGFGGGVGGGTGGGIDSGYGALADLLGQQTSAIQNLSDSVGNVWSQPPPWFTPYDPSAFGPGAADDPYDPGSTNTPPPAGATPQGDPSKFTKQQLNYAGSQTKASNPAFGFVAQSKSNTLKAAGKPAPFGGVVSVKKLANGSTLTTYASGRQVQQAPGKSAYVIKA